MCTSGSLALAFAFAGLMIRRLNRRNLVLIIIIASRGSVLQEVW
jgi:hypothetical protein